MLKNIKDTMVDPLTGRLKGSTSGKMQSFNGQAPTGTPEGVWTRGFINQYGGQYGITNDMIGYNGKNGMVTLGGNDFLQTTGAKDGKSYAKEDDLRRAIDRYAMDNNLASPKVTATDTNAAMANNAYKSDYTAKIDELFNKISNKGKFKYDPESDPVFQALKGQYSAAGDKALANTMSEASSLTGGRLNSWAVSAGQQAKSGFDQQLMSQVPGLAANAYAQDQGEFNNNMALLDAINNQDKTAYAKYQDKLNWDRGIQESDRGYNADVIRDNWNRNMQNKQYDRGVFESDRAQNYQVSRDKIMDSQWMKQFSADEQQRMISNAQQSRQISISEANAALNRLEFGYRQTRDSKDDAYRDKRDAIEDAKNGSGTTDVIGSMYSDMMQSGDASKWLIENAKFMSADELKALQSMLSKDKSTTLTIGK